MEIIDSGESKFRIWDNDHYSILQLYSNQRFLGWWESSGFPVLYDFSNNHFVQIFAMPEDMKQGYTLTGLFGDYALLIDSRDDTKSFLIDLSNLS